MPEPFPAPPLSRVEPVDEEFHGEHVPDPYRWLEDGGSDEVRRWTDAQNACTEAVLGAVQWREPIRAELATLLSLGTVGVPAVRRGRYFYQRRDGAQNQPVLYVLEGVYGPERPLVDPNALRAEGTVALDWWFPSHAGRRLAYGLSEDGSEHSTLYVLYVDSGERLADVIPHTRFASVAWLPDGSAFYYTRLPAPGDVPAGEEHYHRKLYLHRLGTDSADDALVWSERRDMREAPDVALSPDGRWLLLTVALAWDQNDVYLLDLERPEEGWITIVEDERAVSWGEIYGDTLYLFTNIDAPRYRLVAVPLEEPRRDHWREIVGERPDATLKGGRIAGGLLALKYLVNATSRIELRLLSGEFLREVPLPGLGTVNGLSGEHDGEELFFGNCSD